jgi:PASTA domain
MRKVIIRLAAAIAFLIVGPAVALAATNRVTVPNVRGKQLAVAEQTLTTDFLRVGTIKQVTTGSGAIGSVKSTDPRAGTRVTEGTKVNIVERVPAPTPVAPPTPTPTPTPAPTPTPPSGEIRYTAYTTGYGWWDNTPPGSSIIALPVPHTVAGGTGTYADPITLAVGHVIVNGVDTPDFPAGTRWYIPNLRRYFIVEDTCGDGPTPQNEPCHTLTGADPGAQIWLDLWTDGQTETKSASNACEDAITANHLAIENPASNYAVVSGPIDGPNGCAQQYGDNIVTQ